MLKQSTTESLQELSIIILPLRVSGVSCGGMLKLREICVEFVLIAVEIA